MFGNVIIPEASPSEMRGLMNLLALIGTPQAEASAAFMTKLSEEKDAAFAAQNAAAADRALAEAAYEGARQVRQEIEGRLADARQAVADKMRELEAREAAVLSRENEIEAAQLALRDAMIKLAKATEDAGNDIATRVTKLEADRADYEADAADLMRRTVEFNRQMAPVLAAAKAASSEVPITRRTP